eukprot:1329166-Rhodomonas_salina.2
MVPMLPFMEAMGAVYGGNDDICGGDGCCLWRRYRHLWRRWVLFMEAIPTLMEATGAVYGGSADIVSRHCVLFVGARLAFTEGGMTRMKALRAV